MSTAVDHFTSFVDVLAEALDDMGVRAEEMIQAALDSFANRDVGSAESLVEMDELIDGANRRVVHQILSLSADPELREWGLRMLLVSRCLERIGDHATAIAEMVFFAATGEQLPDRDRSLPGNDLLQMESN